MKPSHSVSIAMATYNGAKFLKEQLDSLTEQTLLPAELIITDDLSTDATLDIASAFAQTAPFPVRIERNPERLGYKANFLKAAGLCKSDIIAFCDQDDIWLPEKLSTCVPFFDNQDVFLTYHNATVVNDELTPLDTLKNRGAPQPINRATSLGPWHFSLGFTLLFRRRLLEFTDLWKHSIDFYDGVNQEAHDQWLFFLASSLGSVGYSDRPLVLYRQHNRNTYGWPLKSNSIKSKIDNLRTTTIDRIESYEFSADGRANILREISRKLSGDQGKAAMQLGVRYAELASCYRQRTKLYRTKNIGTRFLDLLALIFKGTYRPRTRWGAGPRAFLRDLIRGVLFPSQ